MAQRGPLHNRNLCSTLRRVSSASSSAWACSSCHNDGYVKQKNQNGSASSDLSSALRTAHVLAAAVKSALTAATSSLEEAARVRMARALNKSAAPPKPAASTSMGCDDNADGPARELRA